MKAVLDLDVEHPEKVSRAISPSLRDSNTVTYTVETDNGVHIEIETESLGQIRGATNTAMMLTKLSNNVLTRED